MAREPITGPDSGPEPPFPIKLNGRIIKGFGRGSKELGIPTANLPIDGEEVGGHTDIDSGVYYGWAGVSLHGVLNDSTKAAEPKGQNHDREDAGAAQEAQASAVAASESLVNGHDPNAVIYPAVLSIGYNPYYNNSVRSVEIHLIHSFEQDFYNAMLNLSILGFIRPERNYDSMEALVADIKFDIEVAKKSLDRQAYEKEKGDKYLIDFSWDEKK